ncbi:glycosyltransferase family 2 protein [Acuticoccus sp. M5D2P5]|uniref:glycosyltransferase family 2 protein n=1 Tax=Acuticoccus kalidii TaxID=2910977 RepID=UPI001F15B637|nr:glycosyltransferase family 2 protein [Acuticoccus kalidii]MCF3933865.1 glycosyltransferase family 2 protein [Acuticoccus kalidii]
MAGAPHPTITLVAIVKNEAHYLDEWIGLHRLLGVNRFLVYDNGSTDGTRALLDRWAEKPWLHVVDWPDRPNGSPQRSAYRNAARRAKTDWIAFFDADEFLVLHRHESVGAWLATIPEEAEAIGVNWRCFGSAGLAERDERPVTERFVMASTADFGPNRHVKTIARARDLVRMEVHTGVFRSHEAALADGAEAPAIGRYVSPSGAAQTFPSTGLSDRVDWSVAQLNHYYVKSRAEFLVKQTRGSANAGADDPKKFDHPKQRPEAFATHDRNDEEDRALLDRLALIREKRVAARRARARGDGPGEDDSR